VTTLGFKGVMVNGYTDAAVLENAKIGSDAILLNEHFRMNYSRRESVKFKRTQSGPAARPLRRAMQDFKLSTSARVPSQIRSTKSP
jgi:hypothetical protein